MGKTLFLGHADTEMRGGPVIFTSIYQAWPGEKYMIFEKSYKTMIKHILNYMFKTTVDKIVMENEYFSDVFIALLIKIFKRKIRIYGPAYHIPPKPEINNKFLKHLIHYADYKLGIWFMAISHNAIYTENSYMKNYLESINSKANVIVESPGIDKKFLKPLSSVLSLSKDIDFLFLTSFTYNKGMYDYLNLVNSLSKKFNGIKFAMGGFSSAQALSEIHNFMKLNNINNMEIHTNLSEDEKYSLYSRARVYILPSMEDGIPITFYEAWGYGDIVVSYLLDTYIDVKELIVPVELHNQKELLDKCIEIYENYDKFQKIYAERCYNYSLNHSYESGIINIINRLS
jgi:glycosyltransferase involved in cell wall biosynthesis